MNKKKTMVTVYGMAALLFVALVAAVWQLFGGEGVGHSEIVQFLFGGGLSMATVPMVSVPATHIREVSEGLGKIDDKISGYQLDIARLERDLDEQRGHVDNLRRSRGGAGLETKGPNDVVSEGCARWLHAIWVRSGVAQGKLAGHQQIEEHLKMANETLGVTQRAGLTTTDIPMPTNFGKEIVELVWKYGQFRKYVTNFPLGALTTQLPKLKTSPAFGFIDMSAAVPEKSPQIQFVAFTALKAGGIVRLPSEIDADSAPSMGQFLARYVAREMAKWEDTCGFLADGSGTYKTRSGICKTADTLTFKIQLTAGNSNASTITIANLRSLRAKVDAAALGTSAYYLHPTMEAHLSSMNTSTYVPYVASGPNGPTFEGFPIRWIGVMPIYETTTRLNQYQVVFGDLSYWYFGERGVLDLQVSRDVFFATDEIAVRALERFDFQLMADAAVAVLQLAAS